MSIIRIEKYVNAEKHPSSTTGRGFEVPKVATRQQLWGGIALVLLLVIG